MLIHASKKCGISQINAQSPVIQQDNFAQNKKNMTVGQVLYELRMKHRYTQEFVAEQLCIDYSTYGKYEKDAVALKFDQAVKLAELYDVSLEYFTGHGAEGSNEHVLHELQATYKKLSKKKVSMMVELDGTDSTLEFHLDMLRGINKQLSKDM